MNYHEFKLTVGGREVTIETGKYAEQTNGMCVVRCGETAVMVTVCMSATPREGIDFFPLQVDYEEKMFAVGKIPGGFKRREGRASDKAILTARLIDRPLRPLFPKGLFNDVVVVASALSVEPDIAPEPLAMIGSSVPRVRWSSASLTANTSSTPMRRSAKRAPSTSTSQARRTPSS